MNIVFLDRSTFPDHIDIPSPQVTHSWTSYDETDPAMVVDRLAQADIVVTNKVVLNAQVLAQCPTVKMVAVTATGVNNVDLEYCRSKNIAVANVSGYAANTVAEHILSFMFSLSRNQPSFLQDQRQSGWQQATQFCRFVAPIRDLKNQVIGIVGSGAIGSALGEKCSALGMQVHFAERPGADEIRSGKIAFDDLLAVADFVALCCPLAENNYHLMGAEQFSHMKSSAFLINTSRGPLVNEADLVAAIQGQQIAGAALDVAEKEPLSASSPLNALTQQPNFILTPHIAWASDSAMNRLLAGVMNNIENFVNGHRDQFLV